MLSVDLRSLALAAVVLVHAEGEPFAEWMMSLRQPDHPSASCCGPADQLYAVEYREDPSVLGGFIVRVDEFSEPIHVPPHKVNWNDVNPTGRGVIFLSRHWEGNVESAGYVYCFVPGMGT